MQYFHSQARELCAGVNQRGKEMFSAALRYFYSDSGAGNDRFSQGHRAARQNEGKTSER